MNIKTKLILGIGMLAGMIILLVTLSVVNLQILTATEPDSPAAMPGLERALLWISITGSICILTGLVLLYWLPRSISKPIKELKEGILEIADHNYEKRLNMDKNEEFREVADSFNRMAERLTEYRASTLSDILSAKKFIEAIVNSIDDPVIGLNMDRQILFINEEALNVLNLKRENVIRKSAEELALKNDLLRRLIRELVTPSEQKEPLKIYADNKESYFKASYVPIINTEAEKDEPRKLGDVILLKNITEFKELDSAKTTFISTISHELKTPIALIQGYAEGLKEGVNDDPESRDFYCDVIMDEAGKMNRMVKNLMTLNQLEFGNDKVEFERFNLTELIGGVLQSMDILSQQKDVKLIFREENPVYVWGDEFKIEQVVRNYVSNAYNHVNEEKIIEVKILREDGLAKVTVFNTGKPIPEEDVPRIWDKFFKVDKAHTREYGGNGIGLSIVKAIMESMHQQYGVKNYDNGVEFWFTLDVR